MATYFYDSKDFTFDPTTKKFKITFANSRMQKIRHVVFDNFHYTNSTATCHVVLVHSNLCQSMTKHKYYKGSHHHSKLDVLFALRETHSKNRFVLNNKKVFDIDRSIFGFEIWFTDQDLNLISNESVAAVVDNSVVTANSIVTEFAGDLTTFIDLHPSRTLNASFQEVSDADQDVTYLHSYGNTECVLSVAYGTSVKLVNFNDTGTMKGITSVSSWQSVFDNLLAIYNTTYIPDADAVVSFAFKLTGNTFVQLCEHHMFKIFFNSGLKYKDAQGQDQIVNNVSIIPLQAYYLVCERDPVNDEFHWTVTKLSDGTDQTATTGRGSDHTTLQTNLRLGRTNTHFTQVQSVFFMYNGVTEARKTMLKNYVTNLYGSNVVVEDEAVAHTEQIFFEMRTIV